MVAPVEHSTTSSLLGNITLNKMQLSSFCLKQNVQCIFTALKQLTFFSLFLKGSSVIGTIPLSSADKQRKSHVTSETQSKTLTVISFFLSSFLFLLFSSFSFFLSSPARGFLTWFSDTSVVRRNTKIRYSKYLAETIHLVTPFKIIYRVFTTNKSAFFDGLLCEE